jgi:DNA-binding CsgD family transcriptional regulator
VVPSDGVEAGSEGAAAAIYLFDPGQDLQLRLEPACRFYGLSPVETRLACCLAEGGSVVEAAERIRVREQTARSYLKQIFIKTATNRQAELVSLLLKSCIRTAPECSIGLV